VTTATLPASVSLGQKLAHSETLPDESEPFPGSPIEPLAAGSTSALLTSSPPLIFFHSVASTPARSGVTISARSLPE
jgi:hypothetical protein